VSITNSQSIIPFLCRAKRATYAGAGPKSTSSRPTSRDLQYEEGCYKYIDTYLGGRFFSGEEAMWENQIPIWAMNYSGRAINENFDFKFLKQALSLVSEEYPFRGPLSYQNGCYLYQCTVNGKFDWFQGFEEILNNGIKVYECYFHGGIVML
jgi:hypothetical protein